MFRFIKDLERFSDFQVVVAAGTSLGYGPFSKPQLVKTLEDGILTNNIM